MGLGIALVDFRGEILDRVDDTKNSLHKLLPSVDEQSESILAKIDWYGDTYFNYLQMKRFLTEWQQLTERARSTEEQALVTTVANLARRCQSDRNILRFVGD